MIIHALHLLPARSRCSLCRPPSREPREPTHGHVARFTLLAAGPTSPGAWRGRASHAEGYVTLQASKDLQVVLVCPDLGFEFCFNHRMALP